MAKNLLERLTLDSFNHDILVQNKPECTSLTQFKNTILKLWAMAKTNWLILLFCLPIVVWQIFVTVKQFSIYSTAPFSFNFGIGYPITTDAEYIGTMATANLQTQSALIMIPLIIIAFVGLAGGFNVVKYISWDMDVKVARTFFRGIKNSFAPFIWMGLMVGLCYFLGVYGYWQVWELSSMALWLKIIITILACLVFLFVIMMCMYVMTQGSMYNLGLLDLLKNAFWLTVRYIPQNLLIVVVSSIPVWLMFLPQTLMLISYMVIFMLGFVYIIAVWSVFGQFVYDRLFTDYLKEQKEKERQEKIKQKQLKKQQRQRAK